MNPIQQLVEEHRNIVKALDAFDRFAAAIDSTGSCDRERLGKFVLFIREYADAYHHAKEEDILFKAMEEYGFSPKSGPVAVMLDEHEQGRKIIRWLREASVSAETFTPEDVQAIVRAIRSFSYLLRSHISKEDNILYPMAQSNIPAKAWPAINEKFAVVEAKKEAEGVVAKMQAQAGELTGG